MGLSYRRMLPTLWGAAVVGTLISVAACSQRVAAVALMSPQSLAPIDRGLEMMGASRVAGGRIRPLPEVPSRWSKDRIPFGDPRYDAAKACSASWPRGWWIVAPEDAPPACRSALPKGVRWMAVEGIASAPEARTLETATNLWLSGAFVMDCGIARCRGAHRVGSFIVGIDGRPFVPTHMSDSWAEGVHYVQVLRPPFLRVREIEVVAR